MANPFLFKSSAFLGLLHIITCLLWKANPLLSIVYTGGVLTSMWNHGFTLKIAKWLDRSWMTVGTIIDIVFILALPFVSKVIGLSMVVLYVSLYFMAKYMIKQKDGNKQFGNLPHLITHIGATLCHVWLMVH